MYFNYCLTKLAPFVAHYFLKYMQMRIIESSKRLIVFLNEHLSNS